MGDTHFAAVIAHGNHVVSQRQNGFLLAPALFHRLQGTHIAGLAYGTDAQNTRCLGNDLINTAVVGQILHTLQHEHQSGALLIGFDGLADLLKGQLCFHQLPDLLCDQLHLTAGGQAVDDANLPVGMFLLIVCLGNICGIAATGQIAGDGDTEYIRLVAESFQPILGRGAGGGGTAGIALQVPHHGRYIQRLVVYVFLFVGDDLKGNRGNMGTAEGQIGGGIHHDFCVDHVKTPLNENCRLTISHAGKNRNLHCVLELYR